MFKKNGFKIVITIGLIIIILLLGVNVYTNINVVNGINSLLNDNVNIEARLVEIKDTNDLIKESNSKIQTDTNTLVSNQNWEYRITYTNRETDSILSLNKEFDEFGADGWEYVGYVMNDGINARYALFKRPK